MWRLKNKIRASIKRVYHKLNPQYRYILHSYTTSFKN